MPPLAKQIVELNITSGLSQGVDPRLLPQGQGFLRLENVVVNSLGAAEKRPGYRPLSANPYPPDGEFLPTPPHQVGVLRDTLIAYGEDTAGREGLWTYAESLDRWSKRDISVACSSRLYPKASLSTGTLAPSVVQCDNGLRVFAWGVNDTNIATANQHIQIRIEDSEGAIVLPDTIIANSATDGAYSLVAVGNKALVHFRGNNPGAIHEYEIDTTTGIVSGPTSVVGNTEKHVAYPLSSTTFVLAWLNLIDNSLVVEIREPGNVVLFADALVGSGAISNFHISCSANAIGAVFNDGVLGIRAAAWNTSMVIQTNLTLVSGTGLAPFWVGAHVDDDYTVTGAWTFGSVTQEYDLHAAAGQVATVLWTSYTAGAWLASNLWSYRGCVYALVLSERWVQGTPCLCVVELTDNGPYWPNGRLHAVLTTNSSDNTAESILGLGSQPQNVLSYEDGVFLACAPLAALGENAASSYFALARLDYSPRQKWLRTQTEQRDCLVSSGGVSTWFDGATEVELGFVCPPRIVDIVDDAASGSVAAGTYLYAVVYEWRDERGNLHVSEPYFSEPYVHGATPSVKLTLRTLGLTRKGSVFFSNDPTHYVSYAVYRTEAGGSIYYRATPPRAPMFDLVSNLQPVPNRDYTDTLSDLQLTGLGYGVLYTDGGLLPARPVPGFLHVCTHRNRLWGIDSSDPRNIWFSDTIAAEEGPRFNEQLTLRLEDSVEEATALASLDDKLIIFTSNAIYYVSGDGPLGTGQGSAFNGPFAIASDGGCIDPRSVVVTPQGVFYQGPRGLMLLDRGLAVSFVGLAVKEETDGATISGATLDRANKRVHFLVERSGRKSKFVTLDTTFPEKPIWTTAVLYAAGRISGSVPDDALSTTLWKNKHVTIGNLSANVMVSGSTNGLDGTAWFTSTIESPFIKLAGVGGYQRCWRVGLTGQALSANKLVVEVMTDFQDNIQQTVNFDSATLVGAAGDESVQFVVKPQRCRALKVRMSDAPGSDPSTVPTAGYSIAGFSFEVGVIPNLARVPKANKGVTPLWEFLELSVVV